MSKRILQFVDVYGWAIDSLAKTVVKQTEHLEWRRMAVHPKDLEQGKVDLVPIIEAVKWADVIDAEYWRLLSQLLEMVPELKVKPVFLTHHNEKNILSHEWTENIMHIATTKYSFNLLKEHYPKAKIFYIPNSYNHEVFHFNVEYPPKEKAVGYVGRVVPWKGLKNLAQACFELKYPLMMMGKMDKPSYFEEIPVEHRNNMDFSFFNCAEEDRPEFFKNITCYVGNSGGGRETGPLGLMEAMASGVPCISTSAGIAADIGVDDENMLLVDYDDLDGLKEAIKRVMETPALQAKLRKGGWETIRNFNDDRRGILHREVLRDFFYPKKELVSVIIPTTPDRIDETHKILEALDKQTHECIESVVVIDQSLDPDQVVQDMKLQVKLRYKHAVKVFSTNLYGGYNLAVARNIGVIEAEGKYIMLNDSRLKPEATAVKDLLNAMKGYSDDAKVWVFGEKGGEKSTFVENFSMISRKNLIGGGMFCERITDYGGMSQEVRERFGFQGFDFLYVPVAKAEQMRKGSLSPEKRDGIIKMKNLLYKLGLY